MIVRTRDPVAKGFEKNPVNVVSIYSHTDHCGIYKN